MSKVTIITGLPGSGKTTLARKISDGRLIFDDPELEDDVMENMLLNVFTGYDVVVTTCFLVDGDVRTMAMDKLYSYGASEIEWIFFENDPEQCLLNILERNKTDYRKISQWFLYDLSNMYKIPENSNVVPVYKPLTPNQS